MIQPARAEQPSRVRGLREQPAYVETKKPVRVTGTRAGEPVDGSEPLGEKCEGASENTGEKRGLPEHRDMGVRRNLGEGDIDNISERMGTPTESAP